MPWAPELFSASVLERLEKGRRDELGIVPYYDGLMPGSPIHRGRYGCARARVQRRAVGKSELPPEAGVAVYVRGQSGKLAAARIYDDTELPLGPRG
jgi:hypothetical protein